MEIFTVNKKSSPLNDGIMLFVSLVLFGVTVLALIFLPLLLIPTLGIGGGFYAYWNSDGRRERLAREHTERMYKLVKEPTVDIETNLRHYTRDIPRDAEVDLLDIGRRLYQIEGASLIPSMPAICNSIEGARYRDMLSKIGASSTERETEVLRSISFVIAFCYKQQPFDEEKVARLVRYVHSKREYLRDLNIWLTELFPDGTEDWKEQLSGTIIFDALAVVRPPDAIDIPDNLRTQHMSVCASSGFGKTQLFSNMLLADIQTDAAVVVIDSQSDLINKLAVRVPADRLILIDPETCPPALNVFARPPKGEADIATAVELLEYCFNAIGAPLTSMQSLVFRFVCRLMFYIPEANIGTMRELLERDGAARYQQYIDKMSETARAFFAEYQQPKQNQYLETRQQVLRRVLTVLESSVLSEMLGAKEMRLDIGKALDEGKIILISTSKRYLRHAGASLFGRLWISQVMQSVMSRQKHRRRTYLYLDEFGTDYAEDHDTLFQMFEQSRKYELGLVVAYQQLAQLPMKLAATIATNTSIKFAGGLSPQDAKAMSQQMRTSVEFLEATERGTFAAWFRDKGTEYYPVEFGRLEKSPELQRLPDIHERMRELYGPRPAENSPSPTPPAPVPPKTPGIEPQKSGGVGESKQNSMVDDD